MTMESIQLRPVSPVRPVAPYLGGKRNLAKRIAAEVASIPHSIYAEPFVGMGGVFLRRTLAPRSEVINDYGREVATFFRVLQRHYVAFMEMIKFQLTTRAEFERLAATDPDTLTDLERAARFLYLQRTAFGGKVSGRNFGVSPSTPARFDVTKLGPMLEDLHTRLAGVVIECLPYGEFLARYDRPETLFYLDPPYFGCEGDYGKAMFSRDDFERLAEQLESVQGRFIMSLNDRPAVRRIFSAFQIEAVDTSYSIARDTSARGRVGEVLIKGGRGVA
ncbi:D12 class N6 adenine-specific DNA methyltransferase [Magnetospirillum sp. XM-1]|uniref:DNA adenine methylase n=1 Tax=Magnetospirillum sp. XM-1 TaxID=1663591 RepID=UPI00073DF265|nr:D12 class N6 adenine-specific DNA methyltransferase [Magnetospirillum sp. XM-1]